MNKKIIFSCLLLFALFLIGCSNSQAVSQNAEVKKGNSKVDKIEIIDFHSTRRCYSCETIEKLTQLTLAEFYQPQMRDGIITFDSINVEEAQNKEIVQKYQARGSSLFINVIREGKDNISEDVQVWRLVGNEVAFRQYLKGNIDTILK